MLLRYKNILLWLGLIGVDQLAKYWAVSYGHVFRNYQFAFSTPLPVPLMYFIYAVILGIIVWYVWTHYKRFTPLESLAWVAIAAGAISNIGERILNGYVKDFIYLFSGVFNFADFYILFGIVLLFALRGKIKHAA